MAGLAERRREIRCGEYGLTGSTPETVTYRGAYRPASHTIVRHSKYTASCACMTPAEEIATCPCMRACNPLTRL